MVFIQKKKIIKGRPVVKPLTSSQRLSTTNPMIHYEKPTFKPVVQESKSRNFDKQEPIPIHGAGVDMLNEIDFRSSKRKSKKDGVILKI